MSPAPDEQFGSYEVVCTIGEGGLGIVYLAHQSHPIRRDVAIKAVKPGVTSRDVLARFETERQALAQLDHPHIARVYDIGTSSAGRPFFVMELVEGLPITSYCGARTMTVDERVGLFIEVCRAVEHAHRKGILHRDLKPSNVLVGDGDGKPAPKIIDFGIAKAWSGRLTGQTLQTGTGALVGTIEYMSPEQAAGSGRELDPAADVYSLGVMLYELLSGALPFDSDRLRTAGLIAGLRVVVEEEPPRLDARLRKSSDAGAFALARKTSVTSLHRQLAGDLAAIVGKTLEKNPQRRYRTASELAEDLERFLRHEPVRARAPRSFYRARKLARRRWRALSVAAGVLGLILGIVWFVGSSRSSQPIPSVSAMTSYTGSELHPALSVDGRRLAFSWNGEDGNYDIYSKPVDGSDPVRLTSDRAHDLHPAWSPDGRSIAFLRSSPAASEIRVMAGDGGSERRIIEVSTAAGIWQPDAALMGRSSGPAWSPDGRSLAVSHRVGDAGPTSIYLVSVADGVQSRLTSPADDAQGDALPAFSPSGHFVAFVSAASSRGITDIYVVPATGGNPRRVTADAKTIYGLAWASDSRIVFTSNRSGPVMLWSVDARGGAPEPITIASRGVGHVGIGGSPPRLVLSDTFRQTNLWRLDLTKPAAVPERLVATTRRNDSPKYSPDGTRIVFGSDRAGAYDLWIANADGSGTRQLTSFGGLPVGTPRWSPDGQQVVFDAVKDGRSAIFLVNASGGPARSFAEAAWDNMTPSWSRDGRFIYYASRREGDVVRLWKKPVEGGAARQISRLAGGEALESPDGSVVYFSDGRNGIWQVSPSGGDEHPVEGLESVRHSRYFDVTRRGAYFLLEDRPPGLIQFYEFATGRSSPVAAIGERILFGCPCLSVSPDDRWLLYAQLDDYGSDILMLENFQ